MYAIHIFIFVVVWNFVYTFYLYYSSDVVIVIEPATKDKKYGVLINHIDDDDDNYACDGLMVPYCVCYDCSPIF